MLDTLEPSSIIEAAEQAASVGDYVSAERLLREAARLQETRLGPSHSDLANTLNNLGVVCEITEKPLEAEQCYRRAYAIAVAALEPNHPFVTTSGKNLRAFCEAHGKPVDLPLPPPLPPTKDAIAERPPQVQRDLTPRSQTQPQEPPAASGALSTSPASVPERPRAPVVRPSAQQSQPTADGSQPSILGRVFRPFPIAVVTISGLVLAVLVVLAGGQVWGGKVDRSNVPPAAASVSAPAPAAVKPPPAPGTVRIDPASPPKATTNSAVGGTGNEKPSVAAPVVGVAIAEVCRRLSTAEESGPQGVWRCDRPESPVEPGQLFFYTRVKAASDTSVLHRWYRGDELRRSVELQIRASPTEGYRTYSRNIVDTSSRGDWRVELRTKQGVLLHEERFVVR